MAIHLTNFPIGTVISTRAFGPVDISAANSLSITGNYKQRIGTGTFTTQLQVSNDGTNYVNFGTANTYGSDSGNFIIELLNPTFAKAQVLVTTLTESNCITLSFQALTK